MTYQLVPPYDHRRNRAEKPSKRGRIILWWSYPELRPLSYSICGAKLSPKTNANCCYYVKRNAIQKSTRTHTCMGSIITMPTRLSPSAWNVLYTRNRDAAKRLHNIANAVLSSAHHHIIIGPGMFGWKKQDQKGCQQLYFSNTNT